MPEELCQVSPKSHYGVLASHSDPSPLKSHGHELGTRLSCSPGPIDHIVDLLQFRKKRQWIGMIVYVLRS